MSDEGTTTAPTLPHAVQIRADVKKRVSDDCKSGVVRDRIVNQLAEEEIDKRTKALAAALTKRDEIQRDIDKITKNPGQKTFTIATDGSGKVDLKKPDTATFDESQAKEYNQLLDRLEKGDKAIEMAMNPDNPDFTKLKDLK